MLDRVLITITRKPINTVARICVSLKISALTLTLSAIPFAIFACYLLAVELHHFACICIIINRLLDGLDGAVARLTKTNSVAGSYIDIVSDYVFYALIPIGHALAHPEQNTIPALIITSAYVLSGVNFMATSSAANKLQINSNTFLTKNIYYPINIIEGTETIIYMVVASIFPLAFPILSYISAGMIVATIPFATYIRYKQFAQIEQERANLQPSNDT